MEKHQYGFAIMNCATGGIKRKSFWATGEDEATCRAKAREMAHAYAAAQAEAYYQKVESRNRSGYRLSPSSYEFQVVGCSLWQ